MLGTTIYESIFHKRFNTLQKGTLLATETTILSDYSKGRQFLVNNRQANSLYPWNIIVSQMVSPRRIDRPDTHLIMREYRRLQEHQEPYTSTQIHRYNIKHYKALRLPLEKEQLKYREKLIRKEQKERRKLERNKKRNV